MAGAIYFDGETAARHPVVVSVDNEELVVSDAHGVERFRWYLDTLHVQRESPAGASVLLGPRNHVARLLVDDSGLMQQLRRSVPKPFRGPPSRRQSRHALAWGIAALSVVGAMIFLFLPFIADRLATQLPPEREAAIGELLVESIATVFADNEQVSFCDGAAGQEALASLTQRLVASAPQPLPAITLRVLDTEVPNAFAAPGGQIVVFRGLIEQAESLEELAGVLAHELGHVAARDPTRQMLRVAGSAGLLGLLFGDVVGGTVVLTVSNQLLNARYSRDVEAKADDFAVQLLKNAGISTAGLADFFDRLNEGENTSGTLGALLQSHPELGQRAERMRKEGGADVPAAPVAQWRAIASICKP